MTRLTGLIAVVSTAALAAPPTVLKLGSLTPRESPWGQVLRVWQKAVKEKTQGAVELEIYWNATQGDEAAQMSKLKTGQLDGAIVTAVGLSVIDPNVNILQVPGLYADWAALDRVRDALTPQFQKSFHDAGYELVGWGDLGLDRLMSKGFPLKVPDDLQGKRPWVWREDPILPALYQTVNVVPVPTSVPEALPELSTGNVNIISVCPLGAEQLQWSSRLDHLNLMVVAPNVGGIVMGSAKLETLPPALRQVVLDTGRLAAKALTDRIRKEDEQALERLKKRMTIVTPSDAELAAWQALFARARVKLTQGTFSPDLMEKVTKLAQQAPTAP